MHTVNYQLSTLGSHFKTKTFVWALVRNEGLIGPRCLLKNEKSSVKKVKFPQKLQNSFQNSWQIWSQKCFLSFCSN